MEPEMVLTGEPEPDVKWFKDDVELKTSKKNKRIKTDWDIKENMYILEIKDARNEDTGDYVLKAENDSGFLKATINVIVMDKDTSVKIIEATEESVVQEEDETVQNVQVKKVTVVKETIVEGDEVSQVASKDKPIKLIKAVEEPVSPEKEETVETVTVKKVTVVEEKVVEGDELSEAIKKEKPVKLVKTVEEPVNSEEEGKAPEFETFPQPSVVKEGETIHLSCRIKGPFTIYYFGDIF